MTNTETTAADSGAGAPTMAELFPIPDQARRLERFLGTWSVDGQLIVEGQAMGLSGTWAFESAAGGWGVKAALRAHIEGMGAYEEDDLVGFDAETGTFHIYSLTNSAAVHDHPARWSSDSVLEFEYEGLQDGKPYREVGQVEFLDPTRMHVVSTDYVDGAVSTTMDATLHRR